jgi:hypothetical protein
MHQRLKDYVVAMATLPESPNGICLGMKQDSGFLTLQIFVMTESDGDAVIDIIPLGFDNIKVGRA